MKLEMICWAIAVILVIRHLALRTIEEKKEDSDIKARFKFCKRK